MRGIRCDQCGSPGATLRETRTWRYGIVDGWRAIAQESVLMCAPCAATWDQIDQQCARGTAPRDVLPMPVTARMQRRQQRQKRLV
jgi:hypothetical protein